jgi:DNA gyrase subunit A
VPARARGTKVASPGERDALLDLFDTSALAAVLCFTDRGRAYRATVHELPRDRPTAVQNLFQFGDGEHVVAVLDARANEEHEHVVFVTAAGAVKRTPLDEFVEASGRRDGIVAMKLATDDRVVAVFPGWDDYELLLVTASGQGIRFPEAQVRPMGRAAAGVRGVRLRGADRVVGACAVAHEEVVVLASTTGVAKRVRVDDFPVQARGGAGLRAMRVGGARGEVAGLAPAVGVVALVAAEGVLALEPGALRLQGREGSGARLPVPGEVLRVRSGAGGPEETPA